MLLMQSIRNVGEMWDHMICCPDKTRAKWRLQYINQLQTRLEYLETDNGLTNALFTDLSVYGLNLKKSS